MILRGYTRKADRVKQGEKQIKEGNALEADDNQPRSLDLPGTPSAFKTIT